MFDKAQMQQDFSGAAGQYDEHAILQRNIFLNLVKKIKPKLAKSAHVLDVGCGTGQLVAELPDHHITQLDIAFAMCKQAKKTGDTINATMEALPFADNKFDAVFSSLALQWAPDWHHAVAEMQRVLKPGGILALSTFGDGTLEEMKESFGSGDRHPHVSWFPPASEFDEKETITEYYPDLTTLMQHLKTIGARNKLLNRRKSLMTQGQLEAVEKFYRQHFGKSEGLPVTWNVLYSITVKQ